MPRVIMFVFAGRQANMELQLPFTRRVLAENPQVEYHIWNLCRDASDVAFLRTIQGERITVRDDYYEQRPGWNQVYWHYADPAYRDCLFVKLDDDVVFLETDRFGAFVDAIAENPGVVLAANTVNNGACTPLEPGLWEQFVDCDIPLLDVHMSNAYAERVHGYFFEHTHEMLGQPVELVETLDWLSINAIGYDWAAGRRFSARLGQPHTGIVAGRSWSTASRLGDEGSVNMYRRIIVRGFVAGHLTFGPQAPSQEQLDRWRSRYAEISQCYLTAAPALQ